MALATHKLYRSEITRFTRDPSGPVVRDLYKRAKRVELAAKRDVGVRSGKLRASISMEYVSRPWPTYKVGSKLRYALVHHEGARPHEIRAKRRRGALRIAATSGATLYRTRVKHPGHEGRKYLSKNLYKALR